MHPTYKDPKARERASKKHAGACDGKRWRGWELCSWKKKRRRPEEGSRGGEGGDIRGWPEGWVKETLNKETLLKS